MDLPSSHRADDFMASALPLPVLQVLLKQEDLEIAVTSSFCLDLPPRIANIKTIDQLLVEVKESHLWIARTGNCHIEISVAVNDDPILENEQLDTFARSIKHCDVCQPYQVLSCLRLTMPTRCGVALASASSMNATHRPSCQASRAFRSSTQTWPQRLHHQRDQPLHGFGHSSSQSTYSKQKHNHHG